MDFRDPKVQKIALIALSLVIVGYFWNARVYGPKSEMIETKTQEREALVTKLKSVEMKARSLEELKLEYGNMLKRYHDIEALLPEVKQLPSFLVQLHTASSLSGSKITIVDSQKVVSESFYDKVTFSVELAGTYNTFGQFISYVANFPFITNVSEMNIKSYERAKSNGALTASSMTSDADESQKRTETLIARFKLSIYYVRPEGRLNELAIDLENDKNG